MKNQSKHPLYGTWKQMIGRCYNVAQFEYKFYGKKGVLICDDWIDSFETFINDIGERPSREHSIDRIDPSGHYEPRNCRWATIEEQAQNKRATFIAEKAIFNAKYADRVATFDKSEAMRKKYRAMQFEKSWKYEDQDYLMERFATHMKLNKNYRATAWHEVAELVREIVDTIGIDVFMYASNLSEETINRLRAGDKIGDSPCLWRAIRAFHLVDIGVIRRERANRERKVKS